MKEFLEFKQIGKLAPSKDFKEQAKKRLMQRVRQEKTSWLEALLYDFQKIKPASSFYLLSKERLFYRIANPLLIPNWFKRLFLNRRALSLATTCAILFVTIFSFSIYTPQTVEASHSVYLVISDGNPLIKPLGKTWEVAGQLQELKIGDTIQTDNNDVVEIHFFDNSVTRMAPNSELTITTFLKENYNETVELELNKGRAWSKVVQVVSNTSDFTVKTHNSSVSTQNATFDIVAGENEPTAINVIDRLIDVKILQSEEDNVVAKTKVAEGYKVEVQVSSEKTVAQTAQIVPIEGEENDMWFTDNLAKDKIYLDNFEKKREEHIIAAAGILPSSPLYTMKKGIESAKQAMTNSDEAIEEFEKMKQKLQEAVALSAKQENEESAIVLEEFKVMFAEIKNKGIFIPELRAMLTEMQDYYVAVLPGNPEYKIKELLRELELQVAEQPEAVVLKRTTEKLFEAQDLIENDMHELAGKLLVSISQDKLLLTGTGELTVENKKAVILQRTEELQILQALKENAKSADLTELIALVDTIHQSTVQEINKLAPQPTKPVQSKIVVVNKEDPKIRAQEFVDKIYIYKTQRGQDNQLITLLGKIPNNKKQISTLIEIKKLLPIENQYLVTQKILEIAKK